MTVKRLPPIPPDLRMDGGACRRCYYTLRPLFEVHGMLYPEARNLLYRKLQRVMDGADPCPDDACPCGRRKPKAAKVEQDTLLDVDAIDKGRGTWI